MGRKGEKIKTVSSDIMRRGPERDQPEKHQGPAEVLGPRHSQCNQSERSANDELQAHNPKSFRAKPVHQWRPQRFDDPGQGQPAGIKCDIGIRNLEILIHHHRQGRHHDVRDSLREIERRYPAPHIRGKRRGFFGGGRDQGNFRLGSFRRRRQVALGRTWLAGLSGATPENKPRATRNECPIPFCTHPARKEKSRCTQVAAAFR